MFNKAISFKKVELEYSIDWNSLMKSYNGNIKKSYKDILQQNIPGKVSDDNLESYVKRILDKYKPTVLVLTETSHESLATINFSGYRLVKGKQRQAEIIRCNALVRNDEAFEDKSVETEIPSVRLKFKDFEVLGQYREWNKCARKGTDSIELQNKRWKDFLPVWKSVKEKGVCLGDFNFCDIEDSTQYQRQFDHIRTSVKTNFLNKGWRQLMTKTTRATKTSKSCLDHVYTNINPIFVDRLFNKNVTSTDHNLTGLRILTQFKRQPPRRLLKRDIDEVSPEIFSQVFENSNLHELFGEDNVEKAVDIFQQKLTWALDKLAPLRSIVIRTKHQPWMTPELKVKLRQRDNLRLQAEREDTEEVWREYKSFKNAVKRECDDTKKAFYDSHLNVADSKKLWQRVKERSGLETKSERKIEIEHEGRVISDDKELANFFNVFFKEKVEKLQEKVKPDKEIVAKFMKEYIGDKTVPTFNFKTVSSGFVKKTISKLNNTKATGDDKISVKVLKKFSDSLCSPIKHLVNLCINSGTFPSQYKRGCIKPLEKSGNVRLASQWRPILISSNVGKTIESVLEQQIRDHLETNNLMSPTQGSYRRSRGCHVTLTEMDTVIMDAKNKSLNAAILFLDQSAAFDVLQKDILLEKMKHLGFLKKALRLIGDYLTGRQTKVKVGTEVSDWVTLVLGSGQGSSLSPLLFLVAIIDIAVCLARAKEDIADELGGEMDTVKNHKQLIPKVQLHSQEYADDASAILISRCLEWIQTGIDILFRHYIVYFEATGLILNRQKLELLVLKCGRANIKLRVGDVEEGGKVKYLGLRFNNQYNFKIHCLQLKKDVKDTLRHLRRIVNFVTRENLKKIVECLIFSRLSYCIQIYLKTKTDKKIIQPLIMEAARLCLGHRVDEQIETSRLLGRLKWMNVENLARVCRITAMRSLMLHRNCPITWSYFVKGIERMREVTMEMRDRPSVMLPCDWPIHRESAKKAFIYMAREDITSIRLIGANIPEGYRSEREYIIDEVLSKFSNGAIK